MKSKTKIRTLLGAVSRQWFFGLLAVAAGYVPAQAQTTYYVSSDLDICSAMQSARAGDTVIMLNGMWVDQDITFEGRGEEGRPITLRAETPGQVILTGKSRLRIGGEYLTVDGLHFKDGTLGEFGTNQAVVEFRTILKPGDPCRQNNWVAHYSRLTNSFIENYNPPEITNEYKWVALYGTYNHVDHCTFKGKTNIGSLLAVVRNRETPERQYHQIYNNYFVDRPSLGGLNKGEAIRIGDSTEDPMSDSITIVESNLFERCNGESEIISNKSGGNEFRNNTFRESEGMLTLRLGNDALVEGNFFFGKNVRATAGVRVLGKRHRITNNYFSGINSTTDARAAVILSNGVQNPPPTGQAQVESALIAFNTFVNNDRNIIIGGGAGLPPLNSTIANNIVVRLTGPSTPCLIRIVSAPENMAYQRNIMYGGCLDIQPVPGEIDEIDPQLALFGDDEIYRPASSSPAINRAEDYPMVTADIDGQPRDDGFKDVGADEVSDAPIVRRPLTGQDVGAPWAR